MSINILKELDNFSKKFDYNFKYRFIWIKFHQKKMVERKNITKTIKTKYAITKFWWWNLKIKFEKILEWENLNREKILEWKKIESFSKSL